MISTDILWAGPYIHFLSIQCNKTAIVMKGTQALEKKDNHLDTDFIE